MGGCVAETPLRWPAPLERLATEDEEAPLELLAMVWGPRFDREHALDWLTRRTPVDAHAVQAMHRFACRFDALAPPAQRAVREATAALAHNAACPASC
jgi:hypothetical protein